MFKQHLPDFAVKHNIDSKSEEKLLNNNRLIRSKQIISPHESLTPSAEKYSGPWTSIADDPWCILYSCICS